MNFRAKSGNDSAKPKLHSEFYAEASINSAKPKPLRLKQDHKLEEYVVDGSNLQGGRVRGLGRRPVVHTSSRPMKVNNRSKKTSGFGAGSSWALGQLQEKITLVHSSVSRGGSTVTIQIWQRKVGRNQFKTPTRWNTQQGDSG